jgi:ABC-type polysaccharide/polyol phosphate export permease
MNRAAMGEQAWQPSLRASLAVAWLLAAREWLSAYRASRWSALWPVLHPALYTALLLAVRPLLGQQSVDPVRYGVFVFVGFSLWLAWIEALRAQLGALRRYKAMVGRGDLGSGTIALSAAMTACIQLAPRLLLAVPVVVLLQPPTQPWWPLALLAGGALVVANAVALGTLLQPWATLAPSVDRVVQTVTLALVFTGGVFLPLPREPGPLVGALLALNPFGALLDLARAPLLGDALHAPWQVAGWAVATLGIALLAWRLGPRLLPIVVERMGN